MDFIMHPKDILITHCMRNGSITMNKKMMVNQKKNDKLFEYYWKIFNKKLVFLKIFLKMINIINEHSEKINEQLNDKIFSSRLSYY
jgi:hypothetical protein